MIVAVDFDGTCVTHDYPYVGQEVDGCVSVLKEIINCGHKLILYTMRSSNRKDGSDPLRDAVNWFLERDIPLFGVNENKEQYYWTSSPKVYAHVYIDDAAIGCPLIFNAEIHNRPFVNWFLVRELLIEKELIKRSE